jgi:RHS repeat-associated protein
VRKHVYGDDDIMSWRAKRGNLPITGIDGVLQSGRISGEVAWQEKSYPVSGSGSHSLKWRYVKDGSINEGDDCGWVDWVQWNGSVTEPDPSSWVTQVNYAYDAFGRRVEKKYDGRTVLKYLYDGDHCIAEYGAGNDLHRKYLYGPAVDEPISMIESSGTYAGTYYYHFDGLGSVTALTNSSGTTVEVYEYDVYGRVGASVPAHPNRIMFTGREYDKETGLYYYRARYYNPQIGRFLQTDPVGYGAGMNWYAYCGNSPIDRTDPLGLWAGYRFQWVETGGGRRLGVQCLNADGGVGTDFYFTSWLDMFDYLDAEGIYRGHKPGDFCDGKFNRSVFNASLDAYQAADPSYGGGSSGGGGATGGWGDSGGSGTTGSTSGATDSDTGSGGPWDPPTDPVDEALLEEGNLNPPNEGLGPILASPEAFKRWLVRAHPADQPLSVDETIRVAMKLKEMGCQMRIDPAEDSGYWKGPHLVVQLPTGINGKFGRLIHIPIKIP